MLIITIYEFNNIHIYNNVVIITLCRTYSGFSKSLKCTCYSEFPKVICNRSHGPASGKVLSHPPPSMSSSRRKIDG